MKAKTKKKTALKTLAKSKTVAKVSPPKAKTKKKKTSFLKVLATTIGLIGVASALLMKKEKPKAKKPKSGAA
jgi:hypothetical protein